MLNSKPIYLASPYTHDDKAVREARFEQVATVLHQLSQEEWLVFSPIVHTVPLQDKTGAGTTWQYWKEIDEAWIECCQAVWVCTMPGWMASVGVSAEITHAQKCGIPVRFVCPYSLRVTEEPQL
jgi:hypothetical protein